MVFKSQGNHYCSHYLITYDIKNVGKGLWNILLDKDMVECRKLTFVVVNYAVITNCIMLWLPVIMIVL